MPYKDPEKLKVYYLKNKGDYKIQLIEETEDKSRERYYILNSKCVNKNIPGRTRKEYRQDNKNLIIKYSKEYYENNKNKQKKYYKDNSESIKKKALKRMNYRKSFGGDERYNNNLLKIDPNLFLVH